MAKEKIKLTDLFTKYVLGLFLMAMTAGAIWQVFSRYILNNPSTITEELLRYMLVWGTMLGAIIGFVRQEHMALTLLSSKVSSQVNWWLSLFIHGLIFILFLGFFSVGGLKICQNAMRQLSPALNISMGVIYLIIPFMAVSISLIEIWHIWRLIKNYPRVDKG